MRDFTLEKYRELCEALLNNGYSVLRVHDWIKQCKYSNETMPKYVILRHDVDRNGKNALKMAELEDSLEIQSTYYFRYPYTFKPDIIRKIKASGHEVGYHYEVLAKAKGDPDTAIRIFENELREMREVSEIKSICMHGSPLSMWDNRELWKFYDFKDFGIDGEAYLSFCDNESYYFTDTGRTWEQKNSMRDAMQCSKILPVRTTAEIIEWIRSSKENLYLTVHPERWAWSKSGWIVSLCQDTVLNMGKKILIAVQT